MEAAIPNVLFSGMLDNVMEIDAFPLGVRNKTDYAQIDLPLETGDRVVFCSDGIIEASSEIGDIYGFDRVRQFIESGCRKNRSNRDLIDQLITDVDAFRNGHEQEDDQTVVPMSVLE